MSTKLRRVMGIVFVMMLFASACGRGAPSSAPPPTSTTVQPDAPQAGAQPEEIPDSLKPLKEPYKIAIGATNNLFGTVFEVGVEKGFFLKHGIEAQIRMFSSGQEVAKALTTGDVQLGTSAMANYQNELAGGIKHVAIFTHMGDGASLIMDAPLAITARGDVGIEAGKPETLKGKKVGLSLGGTAELYLREVLRKAGVDPNDVEFVNVPPANSASVLLNNSVDAISSWEPYQSIIMTEVPDAILVEQGGGYIGYVIFGLVEEKTIKENPDLVLRMVAAYAEAAEWTRQNPEGAGEVSSHWIQDLDPKIAAEALGHVPFDVRITQFSKQAWDMSNQQLIDQGRLKAEDAQPMEGHFDTQFLDQVMKDHPEYFADLAPAETVSFKR